MKKIVKRRKPNRSVVGDVVIYFLLFLIALTISTEDMKGWKRISALREPRYSG